MARWCKNYTENRKSKAKASLKRELSTRIKVAQRRFNADSDAKPLEIDIKHFFKKDLGDEGVQYAEQFVKLQADLVEKTKAVKRATKAFGKCFKTLRFPIQREEFKNYQQIGFNLAVG